MESKIQTKRECFICGKKGSLESHHIFGGRANRRHSEEDGLKVWLCHNCHNEPPDGVHFNRARMLLLRRMGQRFYEREHSHEEYLERYGRNYL